MLKIGTDVKAGDRIATECVASTCPHTNDAETGLPQETRSLALNGVLLLGREAAELIVSFQLFYAVGDEFLKGVRSKRKSVEAVEKRGCAPHWPKSVPSGKDRVYLALDHVAKYFGDRSGSGPISLFKDSGPGRATTDLSIAGWQAWNTIRNWLMLHGVIEQESFDFSERFTFPASRSGQLRWFRNDSTGREER